MEAERLTERIDDYLKALKQLEKAVAQPKNEFIRDSVIQRFEFTHELAWKMLKLQLEAEGLIVRTPRETLQEALQAGLIEDGNLWSDMQKMRNLTSHTYHEQLAEDVYAFIVGQALHLFQLLAEKSRTWQTNN
ncbi:MAG TPA: nucleotidyltransferase substrate binding protein [Deferrimonas sp.]|jgi:nucleotidyltransferase substrate binding protein (TIGR01987 family)